MPPARQALPLLAAACCALALVAGCGKTTRTLSAKKIETAIKRGIETNHRGVHVTVTCPSGVKVKKGDVFTCHVRATTGQAVDATITQIDNKGNVRYVVPPG
jgi:hypothetical protein